jgi:hypothetical protein
VIGCLMLSGIWLCGMKGSARVFEKRTSHEKGIGLRYSVSIHRTAKGGYIFELRFVATSHPILVFGVSESTLKLKVVRNWTIFAPELNFDPNPDYF